MMRAPRTVLLAVLVVGASAACTTERASTPVADGGLTVPPLSDPTTAPATTTTTTPPTTPATTTTAPGTTAPSTTQLPGPTDPATGPAAVFAGGDGDPWLPLGGWTGTRFAGPAADDAPAWRAGDDVRVSTLDVNPSAVRLGPDAETCTSVDGPQIDVVLDPPEPPGFGPSAVAVGGDWRPRPRPVVPVDADVAAYDAAAVELLGDEPVDAADGEIEQIVVVDLDADGDEESLVVHAREQQIDEQVTGYSVLFAVDTATGRVTEIDRSVAPFVEIPEPPATEVTEGTAGSTPTTEPPVVELPVLERQRVLDVLDLNGDRVMEVLVRVWSIDRVGVDVYALVDGGFERVAGAACRR
jgi:hypothetical protein